MWLRANGGGHESGCDTQQLFGTLPAGRPFGTSTQLDLCELWVNHCREFRYKIGDKITYYYLMATLFNMNKNIYTYFIHCRLHRIIRMMMFLLRFHWDSGPQNVWENWRWCKIMARFLVFLVFFFSFCSFRSLASKKEKIMIPRLMYDIFFLVHRSAVII